MRAGKKNGRYMVATRKSSPAHGMCDFAADLERQLAAVTAERDVLRVDAERYKIARSWGINAPHSFSHDGGSCTPGLVAGEYADAAIDAARGAKHNVDVCGERSESTRR